MSLTDSHMQVNTIQGTTAFLIGPDGAATIAVDVTSLNPPLTIKGPTGASFLQVGNTGQLALGGGLSLKVLGSGGGANSLQLNETTVGNPLPNKYVRVDIAGNLQILNSGFTAVLFQVNDIANQSNGLQVNGAAAGSTPSLSAIGGDPNIDLTLTPKGTGLVNTAYGPTALGGGVAPTLGTIGGSGPAAAAQNSWLAVKINGTTSFIPVWR